jgi:LuxR family maltose regulon positive regulatory protein
MRSLLLPGGVLVPLLNRARAGGIEPVYINKLLAFYEVGKRADAPGIVGSSSIEFLSAREMDVLMLLEQGCSDKEIAGKLVIASETVHKHLKNIYSKLDVHRRTEAVARARKLGLL